MPKKDCAKQSLKEKIQGIACLIWIGISLYMGGMASSAQPDANTIKETIGVAFQVTGCIYILYGAVRLLILTKDD